MTATTNSQSLRSLLFFLFNFFLSPFRFLIERIEVENREIARFICQLIPCHCPFERDVSFLGKKLFHIPPLCKLNPLYQDFIGLRLRALNYLSDVCGEDVSKYIC